MTRLSILSALLLAACGAPSPDVEGAGGRVLFAEHCASCHGREGAGRTRGIGPVAQGLGAAPPDLTRIAERRGGVWPEAEIMSIVDGYARVAQARPGMPVIDAVVAGPHTTYTLDNGAQRQTPANLLAIVRYLESVQDPAPTAYVP